MEAGWDTGRDAGERGCTAPGRIQSDNPASHGKEVETRTSSRSWCSRTCEAARESCNLCERPSYIKNSLRQIAKPSQHFLWFRRQRGRSAPYGGPARELGGSCFSREGLSSRSFDSWQGLQNLSGVFFPWYGEQKARELQAGQDKS